MVTSRILSEAHRRGYSGTHLCRLLNQSGVKVPEARFRKALYDKPNKTAREEMLTEKTLELLESLPDLNDTRGDFARRAGEAGFTVKAVWEYYNRTREKTYGYGAFRAAVANRSAPSERRLAGEAEKCLSEMKEGLL